MIKTTELVRIGKEQPWPVSMYYPGFCLKGPCDAMQTFSHYVGIQAEKRYLLRQLSLLMLICYWVMAVILQWFVAWFSMSTSYIFLSSTKPIIPGIEPQIWMI